MNKGTLTFFCGKMGAGKSTVAARLAAETHAVLFSEDEWLSALYPNLITKLEDYIKYSNLLKPQIKKTVQSILNSGTDVIMDFPANTVRQRDWFRSMFLEIEAPHTLVYIDVSDETCLNRIQKRRREKPDRAATDTPEMFRHVTKHFVAPSPEEGFNLLIQD